MNKIFRRNINAYINENNYYIINYINFNMHHDYVKQFVN